MQGTDRTMEGEHKKARIVPEFVLDDGQRTAILSRIKWSGSAVYDGLKSEIKHDRRFTIDAVRCDPSVLEYVPGEFKNDHDIVMAAVQSNGRALYYASKEMKNDHGIVMAAVRSWPHAITYASDEMRKERSVVLAAVSGNGDVLSAVPPSTRTIEKLSWQP